MRAAHIDDDSSNGALEAVEVDEPTIQSREVLGLGLFGGLAGGVM
jgi:hypothetical protein